MDIVEKFQRFGMFGICIEYDIQATNKAVETLLCHLIGRLGKFFLLAANPVQKRIELKFQFMNAAQLSILFAAIYGIFGLDAGFGGAMFLFFIMFIKRAPLCRLRPRECRRYPQKLWISLWKMSRETTECLITGGF